MKPADISDFSSLRPTDFEFCCRAILRELGFQNIQWRTGGRDRGRDIVAEFVTEEPDQRKILQTWFVECKHHKKSNPVGVDDLQTKIAWADAEQPDYLLVITSSHLSPDAKDWFDRIAPRKRYKIRYWEDSTLSDLVARFPTLAAIYLQGRVTIGGIEARRIHNQIQALETELPANDSITLEEVLGSPPDRLLFRFRCPAIARFDREDAPIIASEHKILFALRDYPSRIICRRYGWSHLLRIPMSIPMG